MKEGERRANGIGSSRGKIWDFWGPFQVASMDRWMHIAFKLDIKFGQDLLITIWRVLMLGQYCETGFWTIKVGTGFQTLGFFIAKHKTLLDVLLRRSTYQSSSSDVRESGYPIFLLWCHDGFWCWFDLYFCLIARFLTWFFLSLNEFYE